ncbi:MAG: MFS transporter, partial [Actinobacteria bacterium]|nr:MFS transporter [Actinomycetota bacterium]
MSRFDLLRRAPDYRRLFLVTLASGAGTFLAAIALTVDVFDRTGSGTWVSALLIAEFLPAIVIGFALGPLVDRWSRRRLLIGSDLARLAVFCVL